MVVEHLLESRKKVRFAAAFLRRRLVHTNLQIHYDCTFHCRICDFWRKPYRDLPRLSLAQIRVISEKLDQIGPQVVSIGGGEPLLHPQIVEIVETLGRRHFPVMICNGWFVTPEISRALFAAGMHEISVSVDYADRRKHDQQRGVAGAFDRAVQALKILRENRVHPHQRVHMISVVMEDNLDEIEPLLHLCRELGVTYLVTLYSHDRGTRTLNKISQDVSRRLLDLKKHYKEFVVLRGYVANFTKAIRENGILPCRTGRNLCNIDSRGNVSLCIDRIDDPVGNILEEEIHAIERKLLDRYRTNDCRGCWTSCRGAIETLMYGNDRLGNFWDYYQLIRPDPRRVMNTTKLEWSRGEK